MTGPLTRERRKIARPLRLLIVDDDLNDLQLSLHALRKSGLSFQAETASTRPEFARKLDESPVDIVISDYRMKDWTGIDALEEIHVRALNVPLILLTGTLGDDRAVECIKMGVTDYVLKEHIARLPTAIRRADDERSLRGAEARALEALRESEEHYRTLVENAPEAIVVLDVQRAKFVDCNENATHLFRLTREELLRSDLGDLSPRLQPDGAASRISGRDVMNRALRDKMPPFEWCYLDSGGREFAAEVHLVRLPSATRQLIRGSIIDITDRKRSEAALRESEGRYRGLVEHATYGMLWVTLAGNVLYVNPALVAILGYESLDELHQVGNIENWYRDPKAHDRIIAQYANKDRAEGAVDWLRKDGRVITVRISGRRVEDKKQGQYLEVIVEDVTKRLALEKQLSQVRKFEAIGQLAGGIAHDFNNMIGAMLGWADMGLDETQPDSRLHRHFAKIRHQAERAASLTKQLLAFARRQILEPRDMDLNQSVLETLGLLEKVIGSNIEIKMRLSQQLVGVRADPTQVEQVIMNLCINARDAMPQGGLLVIETENVTLDERYCALQPLAKPETYAMLVVSDSGTGMDAATLDRIFEPFFTTKELGKGTGLGLATVYGVVQQHGGLIHVYSEAGRGTTFRVYLPRSSQSKQAIDVVEDRGPICGGAETILVAEDHEGLRELARDTLTALGYRVILAEDGEQALAQYEMLRERQQDVHLLLLDVILPKLTGPDVYERICQSGAKVPVLFATGYSADIALRNRAQQQGLPILQKPYSRRDLARKVREVLDHHARDSQSLKTVKMLD
ncbi:MAG: response regulator [Candidatus Acidiferrales bacterium]